MARISTPAVIVVGILGLAAIGRVGDAVERAPAQTAVVGGGVAAGAVCAKVGVKNCLLGPGGGKGKDSAKGKRSTQVTRPAAKPTPSTPTPTSRPAPRPAAPRPTAPPVVSAPPATAPPAGPTAPYPTVVPRPAPGPATPPATVLIPSPPASS